MNAPSASHRAVRSTQSHTLGGLNDPSQPKDVPRAPVLTGPHKNPLPPEFGGARHVTIEDLSWFPLADRVLTSLPVDATIGASMYRNDLEAAQSRARAAEQELSVARKSVRADRERIAVLEKELTAHRDELDRLQKLAGAAPSKLGALVARGQRTVTRRDRAEAQDRARRQPSRRREELSTTPFGCFATIDALHLYAIIVFGTWVAAGYSWSVSPSLLPLDIAIGVLAVPVLYSAASITRAFTHRAVVKWAADLPFEINYPEFLANESIESAEFIIEFRDAPPDIAVPTAAIRGLDKWFIAGCESRNRDLLVVRYSRAGSESGGRYSAHRQLRFVTERLLKPLHADYPIVSVRLEGR